MAAGLAAGVAAGVAPGVAAGVDPAGGGGVTVGDAADGGEEEVEGELEGAGIAACDVHNHSLTYEVAKQVAVSPVVCNSGAST